MEQQISTHAQGRVRGKAKLGNSGTRLILLGAAHGPAIDDHRRITAGSTFLYQKEHDLENVLLEAFAEMSYVVEKFQESHAYLLEKGTPELAGYIRDMNNLADETLTEDLTIELHAYDLSTYFKAFLLLAKSVLDKLPPLYSYQFFDNVKMFNDKGNKLVKAIRGNKKVGKKEELVKLIQHAKAQWIDTLIDLRDDYAHYSSLRAYRNFWVSGPQVKEKKLQNISDFNRPSIEVGGNTIDALDYLREIKENMVTFLNQFLLLCEFVPGRRPKHYLHCDECGHEFARWKKKDRNSRGILQLTAGTLETRVKKQDLDYAVIVCPKCRSQTDTDLKFWRDNGMNLERRSPGPTTT